MTVTKENLKVGRVFEARKPAMVGGFFPAVNDRQIVFVDDRKVQYDGPSVKDGRHYPTIEIEKFLKWAGRDVTDEMPKGQWRTRDALKKKPE